MSQRSTAVRLFAVGMALLGAAVSLSAHGQPQQRALSAGDAARLYKTIDSLLNRGQASDTIVAAAIAQQLLARPNATPADSVRFSKLTAPLVGKQEGPLRILSIVPDTAASGENIEISMSRPLPVPLTPLTGGFTDAAVTIGKFQAKTGTPSKDRLRLTVTVPSGVERGAVYQVKVWYAGDSSVTRDGFSGGVPWRTILATPKLWPSGLVIFVIIVLMAAGVIGKELLNQRKQERVAAAQAAEQEKQARILAEAQEQVAQLTRLRHQREVLPADGDQLRDSAEADDDEAVVAPPIPDALVKAIVERQAILYSGAGLSAQANFPSNGEMLRSLLEESPIDFEQLSPALAAQRYDEVTELLWSRRGRDSIVASVTRLFEGDTKRATTVHTQLAELPFTGAVNTAWDSVLERSFAATRPNGVKVFNAVQAEPMGRVPTSDDFVVAKPFGSLTPRDSFQFTLGDASRAIQRNKAFSRTLAAMLGSRSVFFVGISLRSVQELLTGGQLTLGDKQHFALVTRQEATPLQEELFKSKYGIQLIPFDPTPGFPEVGLFVSQLNERVKRGLTASSRPALQKAVLTAVTLANIGAFKNLSVQFNPQWNVVLGNNGSGKSTLLRAIAMGICGDDVDASKSAKRLLRAGQDVGTIELVFGDTKYITHLYRDGDSVRIESQFTPLQQGKWVVMGFPPLRGVSTKDPSGIGISGPAKPVVDDLHPLIRGSIDDRLNSLKQWLVNIDSGMKSKDEAESSLNTRLHSSFWSVLKKLTPGVTIEPGPVTASTGQVLVITEDGMVSIDQVSQGMSSVFGWIGAALQRMHEIHSDAQTPEKEPALILVDEIDAHLHPEWQQRLIPLLRDCFPNLQIIATSHSPLLVAGLKSHEVFVAARQESDRTVVEIAPVPESENFELLRFDQILMSPLFGLSSTRSDASKKEYVKLAAIPVENRTEEQSQRYEALRAMLLDSVQPQSTVQGRQLSEMVREAVEAVLRANADPDELSRQGKLTPELAEEIKARIASIAPKRAPELNTETTAAREATV